MAKSRSGHLGNITGSIGNVEHYNSKYGEIVRAKPVHLAKTSPALGRAHARLSGATKQWAHISYEQAMAWSAFAKTFTYTDKTGNKLHYTGRTVFISVNSNLLEINESFRHDPPKLIYPKPFKSIEVEINSDSGQDDYRIFFKPAIPAKTKIIVFATRQLEGGIFSVNPNWNKKITVLDNTFISGSSVSKDYFERFPKPYRGSYSINFKFTAVSVVSGFSLVLPEVRVFKNM